MRDSESLTTSCSFPLQTATQVDLKIGFDSASGDSLALTRIPRCQDGRGEPDLLLFAVHGFAGGSMSTWRTDNGVSLLTDLLPKDFPSLSILTFGYDLNAAYDDTLLMNSHDTRRPKTFAEQLCSDLSDANLKGLPIVFLCHGVGGIIVKSALTYSRLRHKAYGEILDRTVHVIFMDTPHQGFDGECWEALSGNKLKATWLADFSASSNYLSELNRSFAEIGRSLQCTSFYASDPVITEKGEFRVIESSSNLGITFERSVMLDNTDHISISKFPNVTDSGYLRLKSRLDWIRTQTQQLLSNRSHQTLALGPLEESSRTIIKKNTKFDKHEDPTAIEILSTEERRWAIKDWISTHRERQTRSYYNAMRQENTATWIMNKPLFKQWAHGGSPSALLCVGNVGTGKSVLTSHVIDWIEQQTRSASAMAGAAVLYFFCNHFEKASLKSLTLIACLVKQMLLYYDAISRPYPPDILEGFKRRPSRISDGIDESQAVCYLHSMLVNNQQTLCIIDGLDECDPSHRKRILKCLRGALENATDTKSFKLYMSSREEHDILQSIDSCQTIQCSFSDVAPDIRNYVERAVQDAIVKKRRTEDAKLIQQIKSTLVEKSQGMFLWASLQVEAISEECNNDMDILHALDNLPKDLDETYERCLKRIARRKADPRLALKILKWVCCAKRPLHIDELKEAVAFDLNDVRWDIKKVPRSTDLLLGSCGSLIVLDALDETVRFAHHSVEQFLSNKEHFHSQGPNRMFFIDLDAAEVEIGEICVTYLSFQEIERHLSKPPQTSVSLAVPPLMKFLDPLATSLEYRYPLGAVAFLSRRNFTSPKIFLPRPVNINIISGTYRLLDYTAKSLHWLSHTRRLDTRSFAWSRFAHVATNEIVFHAIHPWKSDISSKLPFWKGMLRWVLENQHLPLFYLLIETGRQNVKFIPDLLQTSFGDEHLPLQIAAKSGFEDAVKAILQLDESLALKCSAVDKRSALHWAAAYGHTKVAEIIISSSRDKHRKLLNTRDKSNQTAFWLAARYGHASMTRLLSEKGTAVYPKPKELLDSAFYVASEYGHEMVIQVLLEREKLAYYNVGAALEIAATNGHWSIFRQIFRHRNKDNRIPWVEFFSIHMTAIFNDRLKVIRELTEWYSQLRNGLTSSRFFPRSTIHHEYQALSLAVELRRTEILRYLLLYFQTRSLIEVGTLKTASSLLFRAADAGFSDVVEVLLTIPADPGEINQACGTKAMTAIHIACVNNHPAVVSALLNSAALDANRLDYRGLTPLINAAELGHLGIVKLLLDSVQVNLRQTDDNGDSPLLWAVTNSHIELARLLLGREGLDEAQRGRDGNPAFIKAVVGSWDLGLVDLFLEFAQDLEVRNDNGETALMAPLRAQTPANISVNILGKLVSSGRIDLQAKGPLGRTALHIAANAGNTRFVYLLTSWTLGESLSLAQYAPKDQNSKRVSIDINSRDDDIRTPLMLAAALDHIHVVRVLAAYEFCNLNAKDVFGQTALMHSALTLIPDARLGDTSLDLFLRDDRTDVNAKDDFGETALMLAGVEGRHNAVKALLNCERVEVNARNYNEETALLRLARSGSQVPCFGLLVKSERVDVNAHTSNGETALIRVVQRDSLGRLVELLSSHWVYLDARNKEGETAFIVAARLSSLACLRLLIVNKRIDVNVRDNNSNTALIAAARYGLVDSLKVLLASRRVEVNARNISGFSAWMLATKNHHPVCADLLAQSGCVQDPLNSIGTTLLE